MYVLVILEYDLHVHVYVCVCLRFEVLEQVCSCGEVLGNVVSEVERRQTFNTLFTEVQSTCHTVYRGPENEAIISLDCVLRTQSDNPI